MTCRHRAGLAVSSVALIKLLGHSGLSCLSITISCFSIAYSSAASFFSLRQSMSDLSV